MAERLVGRTMTRTDVLDKATGRTKYMQDIVVSNMLYGKLLQSPYAYADIKSIDVSLAKALPGVVAVLTGQDICSLYSSTIQDRPIFVRDKVLYQGDFIAGVAAETEEAAEEAVRLIRVEYDVHRPLLDPREAAEPSAPLLHPDMMSYKRSPVVFPEEGTNICSHYRLRKGDVETAFREADRVIEGDYATQMVQHAFIETMAVIVDADPVSKRITILSGAANPFTIRAEMATAFKLPVQKVRVIQNTIGGSFGGKLYCKMEPQAAALSYATGRPVRLSLTRAEQFNLVVRGPAYFHIRTAMKNDGSILGRQIESWWDTGAYSECGPMIIRNSGHTSAGPYKIENIRVDAMCVYTNKNVAGAFRGYGVQEATWAIECHMDDIARQMGFSPYEFRRRHILGFGDAGATGQLIEGTGLEECLDTAWEALQRTEKQVVPGKLVGRGIAAMHKATRWPSNSAAIVKISEDGMATLLHSTTEQGQGETTAFSQMVGEILGLELSDIYVSMPDTDYTPYDSTTSASRSTYSMGCAVVLASEDAKRQLLEHTAKCMKVDPEEIDMQFGKLFLKSEPEKKYTIKDIMSKNFNAIGTIIGQGVFAPPGVSANPMTGQTPKMTPFWMYGAQAAEVEVDIETGAVKVNRMIAAHDAGRAINPLNCRQQIEGAVVQGLGGTLTEEIILDSNGVTRNANLHDYKIPTMLDAPEIESFIIEPYQFDGPFGAKGLGEPTLAPTAPAVRNAVLDALGIAINELPMTPEKVLRVLKKQRAERDKKEGLQ